MSIVTVSSNFFSEEDLVYLTQCPAVIAAKENLIGSTGSNVLYFKIPPTESVCKSIKTSMGLDLTNISEIPMRWIKGDTAAHSDVGSTAFENTYLVYLTDNAGEFVVSDQSYSIHSNDGYVFSEGTTHFTQNTGTEPRLLLGPMNEFGQAVGAPYIFYYNNYNDALTQNSLPSIAQSQPFNLVLGGPLYTGSIGNITSWRVAAGNSPIPTGVYNNGFDLGTFGSSYSYFVYPATPCFLDGTTVLASINGEEKYVPIETLQKGDLVKTSRDGFKKVEIIGKGEIDNPSHDKRIENRLYKCSPSNYPELKEDLFITGCHSILVDNISKHQKEKTIEQLGEIFITDRKYRLMACLDERAEPWISEGKYIIWHLALENSDPKMNYGIYVNGGLLVETTSINFLKNRSNMDIQ